MLSQAELDELQSQYDIVAPDLNTALRMGWQVVQLHPRGYLIRKKSGQDWMEGIALCETANPENPLRQIPNAA